MDVLVVGAGPAGAFLATLLGRTGLDVLLVDRARFPRWTVCGACLSGAGVAQLEAEGLAHLLDEAGAVPLRRMELRGWDRSTLLPMFGGRVLSRARLDSALVEAARSAGVEIRMETRARLGAWTGGRREVELTGPDGSPRCHYPRVVVAATGLHPLPRLEDVRRGTAIHHSPGSRLGVGGVVVDWDDGPAPGTIRMSVGPGGYVGQVRQEDGSWAVAGALDGEWLRKRGGPGPALRAVVEAQGSSTEWRLREGWRGTPTLTRRRTPRAEPGVFYLGDAAGYVEPFTGEGMGWGLRGGRELHELVVQGVAGWSPQLIERWDRRYLRRVASHQRLCRGLAWLGRRPVLARGAVVAVAWVPGLARPALRRVAGVGEPVGPTPPHREARGLSDAASSHPRT